MLLDSKNELLERVPLELIIFNPLHLPFPEPGINAIEFSLINLLWFDKRIHPIFLSFLETLHQILLLHQMFLILSEVLGTNILNFLHLLIVPLLQSLSMGTGLTSNLHHIGLEGVSFFMHLPL